ncbi:hypothetical protein ACFJGW_00760 [Burkholderiaceae bacterium UC74_6]
MSSYTPIRTYENPDPPWSHEEIEDELSLLAVATSAQDYRPLYWEVLHEQLRDHSDLRAATPSQWERFHRFSSIISVRLDELRTD